MPQPVDTIKLQICSIYILFQFITNPANKVFEQPVENGLDSLEFSQEEVSSALKNASSGNGPDNIPGKLLQCLANELSPHVTVLFNHILKTGNFPKQWKQSYVTPLYKKEIEIVFPPIVQSVISASFL